MFILGIGHRLSPFWFTSESLSLSPGGGTQKTLPGVVSDPTPGTSGSLKMNPATSSATFQQRVAASLHTGPANKATQFSMLHAAAITGDKVGLQKLASGNFCDIDLKDKASCGAALSS